MSAVWTCYRSQVPDLLMLYGVCDTLGSCLLYFRAVAEGSAYLAICDGPVVTLVVTLLLVLACYRSIQI